MLHPLLQIDTRGRCSISSTIVTRRLSGSLVYYLTYTFIKVFVKCRIKNRDNFPEDIFCNNDGDRSQRNSNICIYA